MRKKIAAGNWKMNTDISTGTELAKEILNGKRPNDVLTILGAPHTHLAPLFSVLRYTSDVKIAAQNMYHKEKGAYTGEISGAMIASIGIEYVIIGHSERRQYQQESDEVLAQKVSLALELGLIPIFCCGEPLEIRKEEKHTKYVKKQLKKGLFHLTEEDFSKIIIAYEPIWAIGTGETATPDQAQEMHKSIRASIHKMYGESVANGISILYGGSVKPTNAKELFGQPDIDGGLVGGASLKSEDFLSIIDSF